jgi:hypothetical protein
MQTLSKLIFALCVCLFLAVPPATAQTASDPEIKKILAAAGYDGSSGSYFEWKFLKRVRNYALVKNYPKPKYQNQYDGSIIILKKIDGKWVVEDSGTDLSEWGKKIPEFKEYL